MVKMGWNGKFASILENMCVTQKISSIRSNFENQIGNSKNCAGDFPAGIKMVKIVIEGVCSGVIL